MKFSTKVALKIFAAMAIAVMFAFTMAFFVCGCQRTGPVGPALIPTPSPTPYFLVDYMVQTQATSASFTVQYTGPQGQEQQQATGPGGPGDFVVVYHCSVPAPASLEFIVSDVISAVPLQTTASIYIYPPGGGLGTLAAQKVMTTTDFTADIKACVNSIGGMTVCP